MKLNIHIIFSIVSLLILGSTVSAQKSNRSNYAFEQNKRLGRGVNIIGYDPLWKDSSKARMKARHFKLIKEAGFNNVRIVIAPFRFSMVRL